MLTWQHTHEQVLGALITSCATAVRDTPAQPLQQSAILQDVSRQIQASQASTFAPTSVGDDFGGPSGAFGDAVREASMGGGQDAEPKIITNRALRYGNFCGPGCARSVRHIYVCTYTRSRLHACMYEESRANMACTCIYICVQCAQASTYERTHAMHVQIGVRARNVCISANVQRTC